MEILLGLVALLSLTYSTEGHGRMIDPPMRSSMWRYGFDTPKNYNDNELNCGGFVVSWSLLFFRRKKLNDGVSGEMVFLQCIFWIMCNLFVKKIKRTIENIILTKVRKIVSDTERILFSQKYLSD